MSNPRINKTLELTKAISNNPEIKEVLQGLVEEKTNKAIDPVFLDKITQISHEGLKLFMQDKGQINIPTCLTAEEEKQYRANLKEILLEEKVLLDTQDAFIDFQVQVTNQSLVRLSQLSLETINQEKAQAIDAEYKKQVEGFGLSEKIDHIHQRLIEKDPVSQKLVLWLSEKTIEINLKKSGEYNSFLSDLYESESESDSDDDLDKDIEDVIEHLRTIKFFEKKENKVVESDKDSVVDINSRDKMAKR